MKILPKLILTGMLVTIAACSNPQFEQRDGALTVSLGETTWVLIPQEDEYLIDGVVRTFYRRKSGPYAVFCGTMTVEYELSDEEFHQEFGEPGPLTEEPDNVVTGPCGQDFETLLRMRSATIVPISDDRKLFRALSLVKSGDEVYLEGNAVKVDSVDCSVGQVKKLSNIVLVSYAEVNGEVYGE